jgi:hypothetical protein
MAYNRNNNSGYAAKTPAASTKDEAKQEKGTGEKAKPNGYLHVKSKGAEDLEILTGLFKRVSEKGKTYYGGKDRQGNDFFVFLND